MKVKQPIRRGNPPRAYLRALVFTSAAVTVVAVYVALRVIAANAMLDRVDFSTRHASGATFYAAKKRVFVGQAISRKQIADHLQGIGFTYTAAPLESPAESPQPGSYWFSASDSLVVEPRLSEFKRLRITFGGRRIVSLSETDRAGEPDLPVLESALEPEPLGTFVLSINGDARSRMFVRREAIQFADLASTHLYYALIASEDSLFLIHNGTRFDRILRSLLIDGYGGGSSITAQVVKNAVSLNRTRALPRKIDEIFLAAALESRFSKARILELYANHVFLGGETGSPNVYGFLAAAREYFGKSALADLSLSESATLVAMLPQPTRFLHEARGGNYRALTAQRDRVLRRLVDVWPDRYSNTTVAPARQESLQFVSPTRAERELDVLSRAFVGYASRQQPLVELEGLPAEEYSGLHVYTSIDPELMREAQRILEGAIPAIERRYPPVGGRTCRDGNDRMLGALVAVHPATGEILTMAGGAGGPGGVQYARFALNALAAPASTVKPFFVTQALEHGYTAASLVKPASGSGQSRMRTLLARSDRRLGLSLLDFMGAAEAVGIYRKVTGLPVQASEAEALAMGAAPGSEISVLGLARAYTLFANNGLIRQLEPIGEVYLDGRPVDFKRKTAIRAADPAASFITVQMMRSVLGHGEDGAQGTARYSFRQTGLPADASIGGKTGSGAHEVWMVSVSPRLVVAVLLTYRCHSPIQNAENLFASDTVAPIWAAFIDSVRRWRPDLLAGEFEMPKDVVLTRIDPATGCLSNESGSIFEYFVRGAKTSPCPAIPRHH